MVRPLLPVTLLLAVAWAGCMGPQTPAARASDAARELNVSTRFGDVSGAVSMTSPAVREQFLSRRAEWGKIVRVVDVELASFEMKDPEHATVLVDFSWTRVDQGTLHATRVHQEWSSADGSWRLMREKRASGDVGLFGEPIAAAETAPRPDVQFATRVIQ
jgi:hypothetical protein